MMFQCHGDVGFAEAKFAGGVVGRKPCVSPETREITLPMSCGPINLLCYEGASLSFPSGILHRFAKLFVMSAGDAECVGRK